MKPIAPAAINTRTLDECIAHARRASGFADVADLWSAHDLTWLPHPQDLAA